MYIIIIGCGRLGSNLARNLADEGHDICILDHDGNRLNSLGSGFNGQRLKGVEYDRDVLMEAGIDKANALLAVTSVDNINITVSLIARKIYQVPKIIARVNDPGKNYLYEKLEIKTINPVQSEIDILNSKLFIDNFDVIAALDNDYEIVQLQVNKDKTATIDDIEKKYMCSITALIKNGITSIPNKDELVQNGDRIICTVQKKDKGKLISSLSKEILL